MTKSLVVRGNSIEIGEFVNRTWGQITGDATGCTEPAAIGLAVAKSWHVIKEAYCKEKGIDGYELDPNRLKVEITVDPDVFKDAAEVVIPGTGQGKSKPPLTGIKAAVALGLTSDPSRMLDLFAGVNEERVAKAEKILGTEGAIMVGDITPSKKKSKLDIYAKLSYSFEPDQKPRTAEVRIQEAHDNITSIKVDGKPVLQGKSSRKGNGTRTKEYFPKRIEEFVDIADRLSVKEHEDLINKIYSDVKMNIELAEEGLREDYGINLGKDLRHMYSLPAGTMEDMAKSASEGKMLDVVEVAVAAGTDGRMGGAPKRAKTVVGSGNRGITVLAPIYVVGKRLGKSEEEIARAAFLAAAVTKYVTNHAGYLANGLCSCSLGGFGTAAGTAYLLSDEDHKKEVVNEAIKYFAQDVVGMICDGAKPACAEKTSTSARQATRAACETAIYGRRARDGIALVSPEMTIMWSIRKISDNMITANAALVDIINEKIQIGNYKS